VASFVHNDWVSSVDVLSNSSSAAIWTKQQQIVIPGQERILSGSYDGFLRLWNMSSEILATSPSETDGGHTAPVKAVKMLSSRHLLSSGIDRTIRLWKYTENEDAFSGSITPLIEFYGHKASVDALAVHAPSNRILSGSSDHFVALWSTRKSESPEAPSALLPSTTSSGAKRRKLQVSAGTPQRGPLAMMKAHLAPVSSTIFDPKDHTVGYSTSWDHTLRTWDLVTTAVVDTRTTSHSLLSLESLPSLHLLAAGTSARHITLIDPRASATTVSAMTLRGHSNAVVSLARDPENSYGLVSGSHDGTCRIWDVRSTRTDKDGVVGESVYSIPRQSVKSEGKRVGGDEVKVFGVCWDAHVGILSVGEDKSVQINRGKGVTAKKTAVES
jgi:WD40 repeat protein